ncbi:MAG: hypothetical protein JO359_11715 [Candidatus Eremiobacteraeota bacterium]|nr:hypothetical protein [Candidatus Eremiobacteraeota bacterium]
MKAAVLGTADLLKLVRGAVDVGSLHAEARRPFRIFLCGDPALVAEFRATLLEGAEPRAEAAATLETIVPGRPTVVTGDAKAVVFLGRPGDGEGADFDALTGLKLPILSLIVDPDVTPSAPANLPEKGRIGEYALTSLEAGALRGSVFPHLVQACAGVEVAVARRLTILREFCAAKLTRDCAKRSLTVAAASAVLDHVPLAGLVLGPIASAGDMVAITGLQMALVLQIGSCYGKDPDLQRVWELLPVVGGGFGWRALSRELSGFIPVAGIAIKGAIAYAGTIVVGEGVTFYYEHGRQMSAADAAKLYEETKSSAMQLAREIVARVKSKIL